MGLWVFHTTFNCSPYIMVVNCIDEGNRNTSRNQCLKKVSNLLVC